MSEDQEQDPARLRRRVARERAARKAAEQLLEEKAGALFAAKQALEATLAERDAEILARTREIQDARDTLARTLAQRVQYFSSISHEIRTPLNRVQPMLDHIKDHAQDADTVTQCQAVEAALQEVLDTLTGFVLLNDDPDQDAPDPETLFDLPDALEHAYAADRQRATSAGVSMVVDIPDLFRRAFWGHPQSLQTIVRQMTANAADHTKSGQITLTVSGSVDPGQTAMVHIQLQDTGPGFDPALAEARLTNPHMPLPGHGGSGSGGIGIGLPLLARLVRRLDGVVDCETAPGQGTTIWVSIPLRSHQFPDDMVLFS